MVTLTGHIPNDLSDTGPFDPSHEGHDAYRYQLAYMTYAQLLTQYLHSPAYRELWRDTIGRLIIDIFRARRADTARARSPRKDDGAQP